MLVYPMIAVPSLKSKRSISLGCMLLALFAASSLAAESELPTSLTAGLDGDGTVELVVPNPQSDVSPTYFSIFRWKCELPQG